MLGMLSMVILRTQHCTPRHACDGTYHNATGTGTNTTFVRGDPPSVEDGLAEVGVAQGCWQKYDIAERDGRAWDQ